MRVFFISVYWCFMHGWNYSTRHRWLWKALLMDKIFNFYAGNISMYFSGSLTGWFYTSNLLMVSVLLWILTSFVLLWKRKELSLQVKRKQHTIGKNVDLTKRLLWSMKLFLEFWYTVLVNYSFSLFFIRKYSEVDWDFLK